MLRWLTAGESHGPALVATIDGLPAGVEVTTADVAAALARRRLGYGRGARMKFEQDKVEFLGGVRHGLTLGSPVAIRVGVEGRDVVGGRQRGVLGDGGAADRDGVRHQPDAVGLLEEPGGHLPERDARRGLAGRGPLEHRPGVVERVLLHADEVGVPRARPGERPVAGDLLLGVDVVGRSQRVGVDRVGAHHGLPLRPLGVADPDGDRRPQGEPVPHPAEELDRVLLELHPGATAVAQPAACQGGGDIGRGDLDPRRAARRAAGRPPPSHPHR